MKMEFLLVAALALLGCGASDPPVDAPAMYAEVAAAKNVATAWPVALEAAEGRTEIYQPQPEALKGDMLTARAVVSLQRPGQASPVLGSVWFTARVSTDRDMRAVTIHEVTIKDVRVPGATVAEQQDFARAISGRLTESEVTFSLDQLTASIDTAQREQLAEAHIQTTPPHIIFSTTPATLISVNGAAKLQPVQGQAGVSRIANTPFILLLDDAGRRYYLKAGARWMSAAELAGPWADAADVPGAIAAAGAQLTPPPPPASAPSAVGSAGAPTAAAPTGAEVAPAAAEAAIVVATEPTELIVSNGNPQFTPVAGGAGGQLLYASNTQSDLFLDQADQRYYVLLAGRWYTAASFQGPWQYVAADKLPAAFAQIPADSPKADVLSFVAGTTEAHEAVLDATVPQTASIRRDAGADLNVAYDGDPQFQDVPESSGVAYALNTPEDVLRVDGRYYCCHEAVWYDAATPLGPWAVSWSVPPVIYTLPPSCPAYHVRYVNIYDYNADYVTCGYLPGYTGTYVYGPTIVYGTGYVYPGWYGTAYFPPPLTWGFGAYYDPFTFGWDFGVGLYWGGIGWFCEPWHERWWRDHPHEIHGWHRWGPPGVVRSHEFGGHVWSERFHGPFHERGGVAAATTERHNVYMRAGNVGRNVPASQLRSFTPARPVSGARDNVFAGRDGQVFRRSDAGWEMHGGAARGGWSGMHQVPDAHPSYRPVAPPAERFGGAFGHPEAGLDQHFAARSMGGFRSAPERGFGGGGFRGGGGGGGFHGGGGGGGGRR